MADLPKHFIEQADVPRSIRIRTWEDLQREAGCRKLVLFGASEGCRKFIKKYADTYGLTPAYVVDNAESKWDTVMDTGLTIRPPSALAEESPEKAVVVITSVYIKSISAQLHSMGIEHVFSFLYLRNVHRTIRPEEAGEIERLSSLLYDERSREVLRSVVEKRNENAWDYRGCYEGGQYFTKDIMHPDRDEVFIDAGAYDGDTIKGFLGWSGGHFRSIYAYEPDRENFRKLHDSYQADDRIHCINACLWKEDTCLCFTEDNSTVSEISEKDGVKMKAVRLAVPEKVTFIKMDIEGAEMEALKGASELISAQHPKLAICVYHKRDDLWRIPFYIHTLWPGYRLYLRHHGMQWHETVMYAV